MKGDYTMKKFFAGINTLDALKAEYKRLVKENHPDLGGDEATMKAINNQYAEAVEYIKLHGEQAEQAKAAREVPDEFVRVINAIISRAGLVVELVGSWIWVTGSTYENRDALKAAGYRFASKKRAWYWHSPDDCVSRGGKKSLDEIKSKYGSTVITAVNRQQAITARA